MNGRITIQIGGLDVPLLFAYPAIKAFALASQGKDYYFTDGDDSTFTAEGLAKLMHCAYWNACEIKEIQPVYTLEHFFDWVEERQDKNTEQLVEVMKCYADSSVMQRAVKANEEKKRQAATVITLPTSTPSSGSSTENLDGNPVISEPVASVM